MPPADQNNQMFLVNLFRKSTTPQRNISRLLGCYKYAIQKADKPVPPKLAEIETEDPFNDVITATKFDLLSP